MQAADHILRGYGLAIITGGSSGIGKRFLTTVREANSMVRVCNLSREKPALGDGFTHFPCDLANAAARGDVFAQVAAWASAAGAGRLLLINNSGFGTMGTFPEPKIRQHAEMIAVNISAMVELTGMLLPELQRRRGAVINVASTAAFQPMPGMQTYAATKAFVVNWSVALARELAPMGVQVQVLCPGPTRTNFGKRCGFDGVVSPRLSHDVERVVDASWRGLRRGRVIVVPGILNGLAASVARRVPLGLAAALAERVLRKTGSRGAGVSPAPGGMSGGGSTSRPIGDPDDA